MDFQNKNKPTKSNVYPLCSGYLANQMSQYYSATAASQFMTDFAGAAMYGEHLTAAAAATSAAAAATAAAVHDATVHHDELISSKPDHSQPQPTVCNV